MAVNYLVPGQKWLFAQPTSQSCWATVYTMMQAWKQRKAFPNVKAAVAPLGEPWLGFFTKNIPIPAAQGSNFERAVKLTREPRFNPSPQGWEGMLKKYGLIWVSGTVPGGLHDRILEGIRGDETGPGTMMTIMDPDGGKRYDQTLSDFISGFEGQATVEPFYDDYQILHF